MAENGNIIVGNKGSEYLALKPLNSAERFIHQPYGAEPIFISQEQVGDRKVLCHGQTLVQADGDKALVFEDYPLVQRPQDYIVSVTGIDNIRKSQDCMLRMGIDVSQLHSDCFMDTLTMAEEQLSQTQKDFKTIAFRVHNIGTLDKPVMAIVGHSEQADKLDEGRVLPRYYMKGNAMLYNRPTQREVDEGLPMG